MTVPYFASNGLRRSTIFRKVSFRSFVKTCLSFRCFFIASVLGGLAGRLEELARRPGRSGRLAGGSGGLGLDIIIVAGVGQAVTIVVQVNTVTSKLPSR